MCILIQRFITSMLYWLPMQCIVVRATVGYVERVKPCLQQTNNTSDMQIVTECQSIFNFRVSSEIIPDRCETFRVKYESCINSLYKLAL